MLLSCTISSHVHVAWVAWDYFPGSNPMRHAAPLRSIARHLRARLRQNAAQKSPSEVGKQLFLSTTIENKRTVTLKGNEDWIMEGPEDRSPYDRSIFWEGG